MPTWMFMPKLGINMTQGVIVNWLVGEGEPIKKGQPIVEIETDKTTQEIEAPETGVLARVVAKAGETVPCTYVIAAITQLGEPLPAQIPLKDEESVVPEASTGGGVTAAVAAGPASPQKDGQPGGHIVISPAARILAEELGVDFRKVRGSGGRGRIQKADILAAAESLKSASGRPPVQLASPLTPASRSGPASGGVIPIRGVRALIAERMLKSSQETARVVLMTEVDATPLVAWRDQLRRENSCQARSIGYTELLVFVTAHALRAFPYMNATQRGDAVHLLSEINVGVAVDTDRGLLVPVIRQADRKAVFEIQTEFAHLAEMARTGQIPPDALTGGTFTITNLGMWGIDAFTPVINPPEMAILGVGQITPRPAAFGQQVIVQPRMTLSLAFDHRLVDGAPAARFLHRIKQWIEVPSMLIGG